MITHYIFVRRDLHFGTIAAMITHAAGESASLYADIYDGRFRGATAVVLEAHNERHLEKIEDHLKSHDLQYVTVHESSEPYAGQLMAIGLVPAEREFLAPKLVHFRTLKSCLDNTLEVGVECLLPNETTEDSKEVSPVAMQGTVGRDCYHLEGDCEG